MNKADITKIPSKKSDKILQKIHKKKSLPASLSAMVGTRMLPILQVAIKEGVDILELCKRCNLSRSGLYLKFSNDDCKLSDFEKLANALGYEAKITLKRKYSRKSE